MDIETNKEKLQNMIAVEQIDLKQYWFIIRRHMWGILGLSFAICLITALIVFSRQPIYSATTTLLVESKSSNVVSIEDVYGLDTQNQKYFETQFQLLKSRSIAEKVITKLNLMQHSDFNSLLLDKDDSVSNWKKWLPEGFIFSRPIDDSQSDQILMQKMVSMFLERLSVAPRRKTQLVDISFESSDPVIAAKVANSVAEAYIERHLEARMTMTQKATHWLTDRMGGLKLNLNASEQKLQAFREKEKLVDIEGVKTLVAKELNELTTKLVDAKGARAIAENRLKQVKSSKGDLSSTPAVLQDELIQNLKKKESELNGKFAELRERYGLKHPKIIALQAEITENRNNIDKQISIIVNGIAKEFEASRQNEKDVTQAMERSLNKIQNINRQEYQLRELERDVEANRKLYDTFFTRFQETSATKDFEALNATVMDRAVPPIHPAKPKKAMILAIALFLSLGFGVMLAFLLDYLDNTFKGSEDLEEKLGVPMLGLLPLIKESGKDWSALTEYTQEHHTGYTESMRTIRTGLILSGLDNPHKIVIVTSSVPAEGKTTVALSLAIATGQLENVLLIDADMRRPSIAKMLGIKSKAHGLSDLVAGTSTLEESIQHREDINIDIITSGTIPPNPLELISSHQFEETLRMLEKQYTRIIIDSPPVQAVSDALIMSTLVNSLIYVVRADSTPYHVAKAGIKRLHRAGAPITGTVLNQLDMKKKSKYGYQYNSGYYDEYGYSKSSA